MQDKKSLAAPYKFSNQYMEKIFGIWYKAGCPEPIQLVQIIPPDEHEHIPTDQELEQFKRVMKWDRQAKLLDEEASKQIRAEMVKERVIMFQRQAEEARILINKGLEFIQTKGIDKGADALRAVVEGWEKEVQTLGASKILEDMSDMTDRQLQDYVQKMLTEHSTSELPDKLDNIEDLETVEAVFSDLDLDSSVDALIE